MYQLNIIVTLVSGYISVGCFRVSSSVLYGGCRTPGIRGDVEDIAQDVSCYVNLSTNHAITFECAHSHGSVRFYYCYTINASFSLLFGSGVVMGWRLFP